VALGREAIQSTAKSAVCGSAPTVDVPESRSRAGSERGRIISLVSQQVAIAGAAARSPVASSALGLTSCGFSSAP
jgi:hypothetical protein